MKYDLFLVCIIILIKNSDELNCKRDRSIVVNPELQLKLALFCDYEPDVLPERKIHVNFEMTPVHFEFNSNWDDNSNIKFECNLTYTDKNLKWSPSDHNNIQAITVDGINDVKLWMPKISFDEGLDKGNSLDKCAILGCSIRSNGNIYCEFICNLAMWCKASSRQWPFDRQYCSLYIGSHYNENEILLTSTPFDEDTFKYVNTPYWDGSVISYNYFYEEVSQFPSDWNMSKLETFNFRVTRHSSQDTNTILVPLLIYTVLNILVFTADLRSSTRILLLLLTILIHLDYLQIISWFVPKQKDLIPSVFLYYIDSMSFSMILLMETVILRKIGKSNDGPPSGFVRQMLSVMDDTCFGWLFVLEPKICDVHMNYGIVRAIQMEHTSPENFKWWQFVKIVDRFCFLIFMAFYFFGVFMDLRYFFL